MDPQRYNLVSRDCPVCFRPGALHGQLAAGQVLLCGGTKGERGCFRSFIYEPPKTLARLDTSRPVEKRCGCGALIGAFVDRCSVCIAAEIRERHDAARRAA